MPDSGNMDLYRQLELMLSNRTQMRKFRNYAARLLEDKTDYNIARPYLADDLINIVVEKMLLGKYHWNMNSCSLKTFFWFRLRTVTMNIIKQERQFHPTEIKEDNTGNDEDDFDNDELPNNS